MQEVKNINTKGVVFEKKSVPIPSELKPPRPILYPKDAPMENLLPINAPLKDICAGMHIPAGREDPPAIVMFEKGVKAIRDYFAKKSLPKKGKWSVETLDGVMKPWEPK